MTLIFGKPAEFEVTPLGATPKEGFAVKAGLFRKFVGAADVQAFDPFQLVCFDLAVREVLGA